ncbi:hypothetical protein C8A01DRAFT_51599 [Parachaetomium inaequale]|uniref:Heterokaryon incompatibility domain-containing protein n=1 Tax=Parachaetomium inaequale TaxID=2588326 RepID=A0AAN6P3U6_9PEZI|nr:hypothetical protein C8A01DRAFT_51599 [Parachaetomium inaequale]
MDHIQLPLGGLDPIEVPYVSTLAFDNEDFETFPTRAGFPRVDDHDGWLDTGSDQIASLLQTWLYFGLIAARLADTAPGSSLALIPLLDDWSASTARAGNELPQEERASRLLEAGAAALSHFQLLPQATVSPLPEILLSISLLITTLAKAAFRYTDGPVGAVTQGPRTATSVPDPIAELLARKLLSAGWCRFKVREVLSDYSYMAIYYISRLRDPFAPHISHAGCTSDRCVGNTVDMANYTTRHVEPSCACPHSSVPEEKIRSVIDAGGIPIVRVKVSRGGDVHLEVSAADSGARYIAISHVWSDGLGNPQANSLPQCQLAYLARSIKRLMPPMPDFTRGLVGIPPLNMAIDAKNMAITWSSTEWFWLDTLCIPVGADARSITLKSKAINQMAAIYAGAHQVLVLDSVMQAFTLSALAWLGRCWTYQEGALAWSLQVQCGDCSFVPDRLRWSSSSNETWWFRAIHALPFGIKRGVDAVSQILGPFINMNRPTPGPLIKDLLLEHIYYEVSEAVRREMCHEKWEPSFYVSDDTMQDFVLCWNSLARRTTTMVGDIHVILANLLRLNAFSILAMTSREERMRAVLWSLPEIPLSLFFNRSKERVRPAEQHGNRWMPLWPDRHTLKVSPTLQIGDDTLVLGSDHGKNNNLETRLVVLDELYLTRGNSTELIISDTSDLPQQYYRVVLHRQPDDLFSSDGFKTTAFILEPGEPREVPDPLSEIQAACLHISNTERVPQLDTAQDPQQSAVPNAELTLTATFDCPCTVWALGPSVPLACTNLPRYEAKSIAHYTLAIQHDVPSTQQPLPQRPQLTPFTGIGTGLSLLCGPFNYLLCAMNALTVYQHVTERDTPPPAVRTASYLTIVAHAYTFLNLPVLATIPMLVAAFNLNVVPFTIGLVYVGLKAALLRPLTAMDKFALVAFTRWYLNVRIYRAWLETYDPGWAPAMTGLWLRVMQRLTMRLDNWFEYR